MLQKEFLTSWRSCSTGLRDDKSSMKYPSATYAKDVFINPFRVHLEIHDSPVEKHGDDLLFGFPLCEEPLLRDCVSGTPDVLSTARGSLARVTVTDRCVSLATDIVGSYRLYYCQIGQDIYVSDSDGHLLERMKKDSPLVLDRHEHRYWKRHGYTTGGATLVRGLRKVPPASVMRITDSGIEIGMHFQDIENCPDATAHSRAFLKDVRTTIDLLSRMQRKTVLCFSGGADSTLLALLMKERRLDFELVFFRPTPSISVYESDRIRARAAASRIGVPLTELEVPLSSDCERYRQIAQSMLFDRHFAILHFEGMKIVARTFGEDVLVVNGQTNDSIQSFGPTMSNLGDLAARVLLNRPYGVLARLASLAVRLRFRHSCRRPCSQKEFLEAFFDQKGYFTVTEPGLQEEYREYLRGLVSGLASQFDNEASLLMYLKLFGFIQGSDLQVVLRSAREAGIRAVVLPFATPDIVRDTVRLKDASRDILKPKYAVHAALKELGYVCPSTESTSVKADADWFSSLISGVDRIYEEEVERLCEGRTS